MPPHVFVRADQNNGQEQETLPAPLLFFFFCFALFTFVSRLADSLEAYKRRIVKFLLSPLGSLPDQHDGPGDDEQLYRHPVEQQDTDRLFTSQQFLYRSCGGDNLPFVNMSASKFAMDSDKRVLYHAQVTLGCNGLRDLFSIGFMRQDTIERRINAAGKRIVLNGIVSLCAVWLREKIGRVYSNPTMAPPSLKDLCLFLDSKDCSRDMCCQILWEAFQEVDPSHTDKVALRVGHVTLTSFRAVVDHIYDHWYLWLLEGAGPEQTPHENVAATGASGHFPAAKEGKQRAKDGQLPYPAYNHDLVRLSTDEYDLGFQAGLEQLHKDQQPAPGHRNGDVSYGDRAPIGHCPPYDLGCASSWGSQPDQSERCVTRLQGCVCKTCHVKGWLSHIPKEGADVPDSNVDALGRPVKKNEGKANDAERADLLAKLDRLAKRHRDPFFAETDSEDERTQDPKPLVFGRKQPQVSHPEHDGNKGKTSKGTESASSSDLICLDDDGIAMAEVDRFLADLEASLERGEQSSVTALQVEGESYDEEGMYEESAMEVSLLDGSPQKSDVQSLPSGLTSDIQIGCIKPLRRDPPYHPLVHDLFRDRDNVWVQRVKRPTALDMWDAAESSGSKDGNQQS
ncbi:uncharacterized protein TRIREDRAFT_103579 [Trichoderma reesei QM6a]|uniref:Predicted protein n=1 Tax=Hypocrea jecorina (strain QM6a) TaxID=431241 RepID=G0RAU8_HYPJQ|nr:uncharacterized protein TRIREDRAFT_103579 [Trichoderma reesei QM6a]EGR51664.1 predicted protein [Trichoderma reesei QM6a]